jgi:hypothetical protein
VDFSDQHVYSRCVADVPGHEWATDKGKLGTLKLPFTPPTWHIRDNKWVGGDRPPRLTPSSQGNAANSVWFMKDTLRNYSTGIYMVRDTDECMGIAEKENAYVVQPMIMPYLFDNRKHHLRIYFLLHSPPCTDRVDFYYYHEGYFVTAIAEFDPWNMDRDVQITRDRSCLLSEWGMWEETKPKVQAAFDGLAAALRPKLRPVPEKSAFMVMGLDFMLDPQKKLWLFECNAGPVLREAEKPMIKAMMDLVCPDGSGVDALDEVVGKLWLPVGTGSGQGSEARPDRAAQDEAPTTADADAKGAADGQKGGGDAACGDVRKPGAADAKEGDASEQATEKAQGRTSPTVGDVIDSRSAEAEAEKLLDGAAYSSYQNRDEDDP